MKMRSLIDEVGIDIEMHMHNDFGSHREYPAGIKAGATHAGVTVLGLGERAGNAALEEVVMVLKFLEGIDLKCKTTLFREISEYVARASGRELPSWKAIVGTNMFAHESGIHADGAIKNPLNYEAFEPEEVGLTRQIVIGKHSGTRAIKTKFLEYGIKIDDQEAQELLENVRATSVDLKRSLFDKELAYIYDEYIAKKEA